MVRDRYDLLLAQSVIDLTQAPGRRGVEIVDGRIHYHIRHSLPSVRKADRVGSARHIVIARVVGDSLWVLAFAHDSMVDERDDRISQGEAKWGRVFSRFDSRLKVPSRGRQSSPCRIRNEAR
jgi:hypothetical protein